MQPLRFMATNGTDLACRVVGRRHVVRAARYVLRRSSLDVPNNIRTNGESWLQRSIFGFSRPGEPVHVLDVGANVGCWSSAMLAAAAEAGRLDDLDLHAFEPSSYTFEILSRSLQGRSITLGQLAMSDGEGSSVLQILAPGAGTNSLHDRAANESIQMTEEVRTTTLDAYAADASLGSLSLVKIDTEGHDLAVLRGARALLQEQRILIVQFEYNHRWVYSRSFLRDAFEVLEPCGYRLGKLTPRGVEFYPHWDADLESFVESNYIACQARAMSALPAVRWWKSAG